MKSYNSRMDKLDAALPPDEEGESVITIIRLAWNEEEAQPPVTYRRGAGGVLLKKVGIDTVPPHLAGAAVNVIWNEDELDVESLI